MEPELRFEQPRLIVDIGGTFARFGLEIAPHAFEQGESLVCDEYADFHAAVSAYLAGLKGVNSGAIRHAALAIANPVAGGFVRMTNCHWEFSIEHMRQRLHLDNLMVVNDFTGLAMAMAMPSVTPRQRRQSGGGTAVPRSVVGLIGAGTDLGVSGLIPADDG